MKKIYIVQSICTIEFEENLTRPYKAFAKKEDALECMAEVGHQLDEYKKLLKDINDPEFEEEDMLDAHYNEWDKNHPFYWVEEGHQADGWEMIEVDFFE